MILKNKAFYWALLAYITCFSSCKIYSLTGANVEGKTINIAFIENNARNIVPNLSAVFTDKLRQRILSQTSLAQLNSQNVDYEMSGQITQYEISVASITGTETSARNRLTIAVEIEFISKLNTKNNFTQTFTRFADFPSSQNIQTVENQLIASISEQLADDIFNKAFVNW